MGGIPSEIELWVSVRMKVPSSTLHIWPLLKRQESDPAEAFQSVCWWLKKLPMDTLSRSCFLHESSISKASVLFSACCFPGWSNFLILFPVFFFFSPQHEHKLTVCNKLCYAIGGAPYQITGCALGFFLQLYLLDVAQVSHLKSSQSHLFAITFIATQLTALFKWSSLEWEHNTQVELLPLSSPVGTYRLKGKELNGS